MPALTYYDAVGGTSIWRCSQPCNGFFSKNLDDQAMLEMIGLCNSSPNGSTKVAIFDARPLLNAQANMVKGGGYEACGPGKNYSNCSIVFGDIENIHDVRRATEKLWSLGLSKADKAKPNSQAREWMMTVD